MKILYLLLLPFSMSLQAMDHSQLDKQEGQYRFAQMADATEKMATVTEKMVEVAATNTAVMEKLAVAMEKLADAEAIKAKALTHIAFAQERRARAAELEAVLKVPLPDVEALLTDQADVWSQEGEDSAGRTTGTQTFESEAAQLRQAMIDLKNARLQQLIETLGRSHELKL